jgi:aldose 1-epimerase
MTTFVTLRNHDLWCEIKPELGGCIAGLWLGDVPVLQSTRAADLHSVRQSGSYPLVPFSNRIGHAQLLWQGTDRPLIKNFDPEPHAIHGVGWERPWTVLEHSESFALLSYEHKADAAWPFDFDTSQAFKLSPGSLEMTISITNQSQQKAPVGLGWHPYFVKRAGSHLHFNATGRWEMGADQLPTHREANTGLDVDPNHLKVDHCFDGWSGAVTLQDDLLCTRISSSLNRLVVYTTAHNESIAIEPVSHVNNALHMLATSGATAAELGVVVLQPGETFSCDMRIDVERVK